MKVKVKTEFKDKHTGKLHRMGDVLDLNVQRINEILKVGGFVELVEQSEPEETEQTEETPDESTDAGEQTEETPKQTGRRKRTK